MKTQAILIAAIALLLGTEAGLIKPAPGTVVKLTHPLPDIDDVPLTKPAPGKGESLTKPAPGGDESLTKPAPGGGGSLTKPAPGGDESLTKPAPAPEARKVLPHLGK
jgi:hypothetical protein